MEEAYRFPNSFEPTPDLLFPIEHPFMLVRIALFDGFQETFYQITPGGKDGQANHNEKYSLEYGKEKAKDSKSNKDPANDQNPNRLEFIHGSLCIYIIIFGILQQKAKSSRTQLSPSLYGERTCTTWDTGRPLNLALFRDEYLGPFFV